MSEAVVVADQQRADLQLVCQHGHYKLFGTQARQLGGEIQYDAVVDPRGIKVFQLLFERIEQLRLIVRMQDCTRMFGERDDGGRQSGGFSHLLQFMNQKTVSQMNPVKKTDSRYQSFTFQYLRVSNNYHLCSLNTSN